MAGRIANWRGLHADVVRVDLNDTITNYHRLTADESLHVTSRAGHIFNRGALSSGGDIVIDSELEFHNAGNRIEVGSDMYVDAKTISNYWGGIAAGGDVVLMTSSGLDNRFGAIDAGGSISIVADDASRRWSDWMIDSYRGRIVAGGDLSIYSDFRLSNSHALMQAGVTW